MNVQFRILKRIDTFLELVDLDIIAATLLQIVTDVHMKLSTHCNEQYFVAVINQQRTMVEVNNLFGCVLIGVDAFG